MQYIVRRGRIPAVLKFFYLFILLTIVFKEQMKRILKCSLTWEQCLILAAWGCPSCARSSCGESTRSQAPPAPPRKGGGSPTRKESAWENVSLSAPSILIEPPSINTSHIQCVSQCTEGFQWTDCQIVWNWMEFSEVRGKEKEVRRTEHFSAAEGMGSSQGSVCSVTQAYTWGGVRDHLPQEFSFCERTFKRETLKIWESVCLKMRNKVD